MAQANVVNTLVVPVQTTISPYFDDYNESKNFHRILFRPGYAVQARELTQLQTILQNQIERFGRHIFVNGSSVIGGKMDITEIVTLNVQSEYANTTVNVADFKDKTIQLSSGNNAVLAKVVQVSSATETEPPALHVKYISGQEFTDGAIIKTTTGTSNIALTTTNAVANGLLAFIYDSIYFMQGYFIKVPTQAAVISKYDRVPTTKVGLELNEDIVTENSDTSLLDPALEASNYQAPGAARYKVELNLATRAIDSEDDQKFIQIAKLENGEIIERVTSPIYSEIEEVLARRTYDESGNYIVKPFSITIEPSVLDSANNFTAYVSPGKAYLYGFETETQTELTFEIPRARDTQSVTNFDLNANYGNYVYVNDVKGPFNTTMGLVDMHCVDANLVNLSSTAAYNSTKTGTVRVKDINFYSGGANTALREFELYFVDPKFNTITANAGPVPVNQSQIHLGNTANISTRDGAYTNAYITITDGPAEGDTRLIVAYNGASRVANVDFPFTSNTTTSTFYKINFDITDVESFYQSVLYTPNAIVNATANVSTLSKIGGDVAGDTFISEPNFLNGIFVYPDRFVAPGITNQSYVYRRTYNSIQFTSGVSSVITASTDEEFEGGSASSNTASTVMDNWLVIVTDPLTSTRKVGEQVAVSVSVTNSNPEQATLSTGNASESFIATIYAKVNATENAATPRVKTLVLANTETFTVDSASATFENTTGSTTSVYLNSGQVLIKNPSQTLPESLFISDINEVVKIYAFDTEPTPGQSLSEGFDVTNRYFFDNGQQISHYDHGFIVLKAGFASPTGWLVVCTRYYKTSNDVGYFSVDSYPSLATSLIEGGVDIGTGYSIVPKMSGIKLTDVIDFRPVRPNATNTEFYSFSTARTPISLTDFRSNYSYYLKRYDSFVLTLDNAIQRIQGLSDESPVFPQPPERSLLLHRLEISPYTETTNDVKVTTISHRRYTMKDIENLDRRLKNVEYSVSLNSLEKNAENIIIRDVNGLDRTKYGILAENFKSHLLGDTKSPDYLCAIDINQKFTPREGLLTPRFKPTEITLSPNSNLSSNVAIYNDKVVLQFTTAPAITQSVATKTTPVSEYLFADFRGTIICTPEADLWKDIVVLPPTVISVPTTTTTTPVKPVDPKKPTTVTKDPRPGNSKEEVAVQKLMILEENGPNNGFATLKYNKSTGEYSAVNGSTKVVNGVVQTVGMSDAQYYNLLNSSVNKTGRFNSTVSVPKDIADAIYDSYYTFLDRPPENAGQIYWAEQAILNGWSVKQTREAILAGGIASGELVDPAISANRTVALTPAKVLTTNDLSYNKTDVGGKVKVSVKTSAVGGDYTGADVGGTTRDTKPEDVIKDFYKEFLGREPDPAGFKGWVDEFAKGGGTKETVEKIRQGFTQSAEYLAKQKK